MSTSNNLLALVTGPMDEQGVADAAEIAQEATSGPRGRSQAQRPPRAPKGLGKSGRALWRSIVTEYELTEAELGVLVAACRTRDILDTLSETIESLGSNVFTTNAKGDLVSHPALVEHRMQSQALQRAIASLRLPDEEGNQPQRRGAARGSYGGGS